MRSEPQPSHREDSEDLIILPFGAMSLSCDCRDIYGQMVLGPPPPLCFGDASDPLMWPLV